MKAHIITIGDEILVGQTVDTNSTFIAQELNKIGVSVSEIQSIQDNETHIVSTLKNALNSNQLVIITGGLGPTNDDITKKVLVDYFNDDLILYPEILEKVKEFFARFNKPFLKVNEYQAMLPKQAHIIINDLGTASGMWFEQNNNVIISLPGVPYEMKGLMLKAIEKLKSQFSLGNLYHKTILLQGIGEAYLADELTEWENEIKSKNISVSYLPSVGILKVRLTGQLDQKIYIDSKLNEIENLYKKQVFGYNNQNLESVLGELLIKNRLVIGTVESCTAGGIASRLVSVPGSSAYFKGSIVSYANELKIEFVCVEKQAIEKNGAVSQEVVEQMAKRGVEKLIVDYCISTSGIAGPDGGSKEKPVGTVWIGIASKNKVWSRQFNFGHTRQNNIESTIMYALNFLRRIILEIDDLQ